MLKSFEDILKLLKFYQYLLINKMIRREEGTTIFIYSIFMTKHDN